MDMEMLERLLELIRLPYGMCWSAARPRSGKTTTLYACLNRLNRSIAIS